MKLVRLQERGHGIRACCSRPRSMAPDGRHSCTVWGQTRSVDSPPRPVHVFMSHFAHTHAYARTHTNTYTHTHTHTHTHTCTHTHTHTLLHTHTASTPYSHRHVDTPAHNHTRKFCVCVWLASQPRHLGSRRLKSSEEITLHTRTRAHTPTYTHTHIYTHMPRFGGRRFCWTQLYI